MTAAEALGTAVVFRADLPVGRAVVERLAAGGRPIRAFEAPPTGADAVGSAMRSVGAGDRIDVLVLPPPLEPQPAAFPWSAATRDRIDGWLRETFFAVRHAVPNMTAGRIALAAPSRGATSPDAATALEAAATALVRLLAVELAPHRIALNALCPIGPRVGVDAVADALAFLASGDASYVTGATLPLLRDETPPAGPLERGTNHSRDTESAG